MAAPTWDEILRGEGIGIHPAATLFPLGTDEGLDRLAASIERTGMLNMLRLWRATDADGWQLIDGRRRCAAMGRRADPETLIKGALAMAERHTGGDPLDLIEALNEERRHSPIEERRRVASRLLELDPTRSNRQIGEQAGIDHKTAAAIRGEKEATGEIPTLNKTIGKDGKSRTTKPATRPSANKPAAPPPPPPPAVNAQVWAEQTDRVVTPPAAAPAYLSETKLERAKREFREWVSYRDTTPWHVWCETGLNLVKAYQRIPELKWALGETEQRLRGVNGLSAEILDAVSPAARERAAIRFLAHTRQRPGARTPAPPQPAAAADSEAPAFTYGAKHASCNKSSRICGYRTCSDEGRCIAVATPAPGTGH